MGGAVTVGEKWTFSKHSLFSGVCFLETRSERDMQREELLAAAEGVMAGGSLRLALIADEAPETLWLLVAHGLEVKAYGIRLEGDFRKGEGSVSHHLKSRRNAQQRRDDVPCEKEEWVTACDNIHRGKTLVGQTVAGGVVSGRVDRPTAPSPLRGARSSAAGGSAAGPLRP